MRADTIIDIIATAAPFLAPVPTAWLIGEATARALSFPAPVAVITALAVETLGVSIAATALTLYQFNRSRRKVDKAAPLWLALVTIGFYVVTAILLTVFLDNQQSLARAIFPLLSLAGMVTIGLRYDHAARLQEIEIQRQERREERKAAKAQVQPAQPIIQARDFAAFASANRARNGNGELQVAQIMHDYNVSKRTAYNWRTRYEKEKGALNEN